MSEMLKLDEIPEGETKTRRQILVELRQAAQNIQAKPPAASVMMRQKTASGDALASHFRGLELLSIFNGKQPLIDQAAYSLLQEVLTLLRDKRKITKGSGTVSHTLNRGSYEDEDFRPHLTQMLRQKNMNGNKLAVRLLKKFPHLGVRYSNVQGIRRQFDTATNNETYDREAVGLALIELALMPNAIEHQFSNLDRS